MCSHRVFPIRKDGDTGPLQKIRVPISLSPADTLTADQLRHAEQLQHFLLADRIPRLQSKSDPVNNGFDCSTLLAHSPVQIEIGIPVIHKAFNPSFRTEKCQSNVSLIRIIETSFPHVFRAR